MTKIANWEFQMGITGAPFGPIGMKPVPLEPHDRDLAQGQGPRGPGSKRYRNDLPDEKGKSRSWSDLVGLR